jgi:hypothetical protein
VSTYPYSIRIHMRTGPCSQQQVHPRQMLLERVLTLIAFAVLYWGSGTVAHTSHPLGVIAARTLATNAGEDLLVGA